MTSYNDLRGGSRARLRTMREYVARWNRDHVVSNGSRVMLESFRDARRHGIATISAGRHDGTMRRDGSKIYADSGALDHLRELSGDDQPRDYGRGWYADAYCSETVTGRVAVLPSRKGERRFLAYVVWSDCDGITIDADVYDCPRTAWNNADDMARRIAEDEKEHNEKWHEAREVQERQDNRREELRAARSEAVGLVTVLRELPQTASSRATICAMIRECRERMAEALQGIADDAATLADYSAQGVDV